MILFLECILTFSTFLLCCLKCQYAISKVSQTIFCEGQKLMKRVLMYVSYVTPSTHFSLMLYSECLYLKHAIFSTLNLFHPATSKLSTTVVIPSIYVIYEPIYGFIWLYTTKLQTQLVETKIKKTNPHLPRQANSDAQILLVAFFSNGVHLKYLLTFSSKMATENHELLSSELQSLRKSIPFYPNTCT